MGFGINGNKGFHITFDKCTISVQFGHGNYCDNRNIGYDTPNEKGGIKCKDAEVALWDSSDNWITQAAYKEVFNEELPDDVAGWVDSAQVAKLINWASNYQKEEA